MSLSNTFLENIIRLSKEEIIPYSSFSNKKSLLDLDGFGIIIDKSIKPYSIVLSDLEYLLATINAKYKYDFNNIEQIKEYLNKVTKGELGRDEVIEHRTTTKDKESKSFSGLKINCIKNITIKLNNKNEILKPMNGSCLFVFYKESLTIDVNVTLVGVENPQVLWYIKRYAHLFDNSKEYLFILVKDQNNYFYEWIKTIKNDYIHFGDFDISGVSIFVNEVLPKLHNKINSSFLIPENIQLAFKKKGSREIFNRQEKFLNSLNVCTDKKIISLLELIKNEKKGLEQEFFGLNR